MMMISNSRAGHQRTLPDITIQHVHRRLRGCAYAAAVGTEGVGDGQQLGSGAGTFSSGCGSAPDGVVFNGTVPVIVGSIADDDEARLDIGWNYQGGTSQPSSPRFAAPLGGSRT
jgi:hypothetical protein